jgi:hypothetical protein
MTVKKSARRNSVSGRRRVPTNDLVGSREIENGLSHFSKWQVYRRQDARRHTPSKLSVRQMLCPRFLPSSPKKLTSANAFAARLGKVTLASAFRTSSISVLAALTSHRSWHTKPQALQPAGNEVSVCRAFREGKRRCREMGDSTVRLAHLIFAPDIGNRVAGWSIRHLQTEERPQR